MKYENILELINNPSFSSFLGAFFAFLFFLISKKVERFHEGKKRNHNAIVFLEQIINEYFCIIAENLEQLKNFKETLIRRNGVWGNKLQYFPIERKITLELKDIELINDVFLMNLHVRQLNESIEIVLGRNKEIFKRALDGIMEDKVVEKNLGYLIPLVETLEKHHKILEGEILNILVKVRIFLRGKGCTKINKTYLNKEKETIQKERSDTKEKEINKIKNI